MRASVIKGFEMRPAFSEWSKLSVRVQSFDQADARRDMTAERFEDLLGRPRRRTERTRLLFNELLYAKRRTLNEVRDELIRIEHLDRERFERGAREVSNIAGDDGLGFKAERRIPQRGGHKDIRVVNDRIARHRLVQPERFGELGEFVERFFASLLGLLHIFDELGGRDASMPANFSVRQLPRLKELDEVRARDVHDVRRFLGGQLHMPGDDRDRLSAGHMPKHSQKEIESALRDQRSDGAISLRDLDAQKRTLAPLKLAKCPKRLTRLFDFGGRREGECVLGHHRHLYGSYS